MRWVEDYAPARPAARRVRPAASGRDAERMRRDRAFPPRPGAARRTSIPVHEPRNHRTADPRGAPFQPAGAARPGRRRQRLRARGPGPGPVAGAGAGRPARRAAERARDPRHHQRRHAHARLVRHPPRRPQPARGRRRPARVAAPDRGPDRARRERVRHPAGARRVDGLLAGLRDDADDRAAVSETAGGARRPVRLSARAGHDRSRTERRQRGHADLPGARQQRRRRRAGPRARVAGRACAGSATTSSGTSTRWPTRSAWTRSRTCRPGS